MSDNNKFKLAGVMGMPVYLSRSPILHNYWIAKYGLKGAYGHFPVELKNQRLPFAVCQPWVWQVATSPCLIKCMQ
jgi:shikimate 5-dehydrogenase